MSRRKKHLQSWISLFRARARNRNRYNFASWLNSQPDWLKPTLVLLLIPFGFWLKGCLMAEYGEKIITPRDPDTVLKFDHARHARHVNNCNDCHLNNETKEMVQAGHPACVSCHATAADNGPPSRDCLLCHKTQTPKKAAR